MDREINILVTLLLGLNLSSVTAQSLSEDTRVSRLYQQENTDDENGYELNGYVRGDFFGWRSSTDQKPEMKSGYGEIALKLKAKKSIGETGTQKSVSAKGMKTAPNSLR